MFSNKQDIKKPQFETYLYESDKKRLKKLVSEMSEMAVSMLQDIGLAVQNRSLKLANSVIYADDAIDILEEEIDQESLYSIAMRHPLHSDLRFVYGVMKIITDIERIGDQCVNMAHLLIKLHDLDRTLSDSHAEIFIRHSLEASDMFKALTSAFIEESVEIADLTRQRWKSVRTDINLTIDQITQEVFSESVTEKGCGKGESMTAALMLIHLVRIFDHIMNFAEMLNFIATGVSPINYKRGFRKGSTEC